MSIAGTNQMAEAVQPNAVRPNQPPEGRNVPKSNIGQAGLFTRYLLKIYL
jgi:hypothetical protein